jgi:2-hydroxyglutarate dehydrogenase
MRFFITQAFEKINAGMYYEPGSTMAHTCVRGNELMYKFCEENKLPVERCGKMIVATTPEEHKQVEKLYKQGNANGVKGLEIFDSKQVNGSCFVVVKPGVAINTRV